MPEVLLLLTMLGMVALVLLPKLVMKRNLDAISRMWRQLDSAPTGLVFSEDLIRDLPEPVQRYFRHAIRPDTLIHDGAVLQIEGRMKLRPQGGWGSFISRERIQAGRGLVWPAVYGQGLLQIVGFDSYLAGQGSTHWWLLGVISVARSSGGQVDESAAGRMAAEMIWLPGMLLPQFGNEWEAVSDNELICRLQVDGFGFELHYLIDSRGSLQSMRMQRQRRLDDGTFQLQSFGMDSDADVSAEGCTVPGRCRVAWQPDDREQRFEFWQGEILQLCYSGRLAPEGCLGLSPLDRLR